MNVGIAVLAHLERQRAGRDALAACDNRIRGIIIRCCNKAITYVIRKIHFLVIDCKIHTPHSFARSINSTNGLAVHANNCFAVLEVGQVVIRLGSLGTVRENHIILAVRYTVNIHRNRPAYLLTVHRSKCIIFQSFTGFHIVYSVFPTVLSI